MFKFKRGLRSSFKTERAWLEDVFERNKATITAVGYTKDKFVNRVIAGKLKEGKKITTIQSLKRLGNSNAFTPYKDRAYENVINSMKEFTFSDGTKTISEYQHFRNLTKDARGRYTKIDPSKFTFEDGHYIYDGQIIVSFENSPKDLIIRRA